MTNNEYKSFPLNFQVEKGRPGDKGYRGEPAQIPVSFFFQGIQRYEGIHQQLHGKPTKYILPTIIITCTYFAVFQTM